MRKWIWVLCAAVGLSSFARAAELEELEDFDRWYVGGAAMIALPQGGSAMHHVGGAAIRGGYCFAEFWSVEGEVAWLEDVAGLAVQGLWHWWGYERFDPFFTFGAKGWLGRAGQIGPKVGIGAYYHLTDSWSLRFDGDATLGLDTEVEVDYTIAAGVEYSF